LALSDVTSTTTTTGGIKWNADEVMAALTSIASTAASGLWKVPSLPSLDMSSSPTSTSTSTPTRSTTEYEHLCHLLYSLLPNESVVAAGNLRFICLVTRKHHCSHEHGIDGTHRYQ
jgi:hypothetical protein